jgi:hypothetical protein
MIVYTHKFKKVEFWANIQLLGKYKWVGGVKPVNWDECMKEPKCIESHNYENKEVNVSFVPLMSFGYGRGISKHRFITISWLIFDCGIYW